MNAAVIPVAAAAWRQNVVTVHLLALCPMLAVSVAAEAALALGLLTTAVMALTAAAVAALRHAVADSVRLPALLLLVAAAVALLDLLTAALQPALHRQLGIFLPLIITNCAVLARLEVFARRQPPLAAAADGAVSGLGMTLALLALAIAREFLGSGSVAGAFSPPLFGGLPLALLPAGGLVLFALMLALINLLRRR